MLSWNLGDRGKDGRVALELGDACDARKQGLACLLRERLDALVLSELGARLVTSSCPLTPREVAIERGHALLREAHLLADRSEEEVARGACVRRCAIRCREGSV